MEPSRRAGRPAMNVALSPDDLARACADAMWKEDDASKGLGMKIVEIKPGRGDDDDDGAAAHGQRPAHRPWRLHLPAGRFHLRLCLQLPQRARCRRAMRHHLHPSGQARRRAGRNRAGNFAQRPVRDLRRPRYRRRRRDRRVPRPFPHHRGHLAADGGRRGHNKIPTRGNAPWPRRASNPSASGYSAEMDEAERASRDEIMALQTRRLAWSLKHAYDNVATLQEGVRQGRRASLRFQGSLPISQNSRSR